LVCFPFFLPSSRTPLWGTASSRVPASLFPFLTERGLQQPPPPFSSQKFHIFSLPSPFFTRLMRSSPFFFFKCVSFAQFYDSPPTPLGCPGKYRSPFLVYGFSSQPGPVRPPPPSPPWAVPPLSPFSNPRPRNYFPLAAWADFPFFFPYGEESSTTPFKIPVVVAFLFLFPPFFSFSPPAIRAFVPPSRRECFGDFFLFSFLNHWFHLFLHPFFGSGPLF